MRSALLVILLLLCPVLAHASAKDAIEYAQDKRWDEARTEAASAGNVNVATIVDWLYMQDPDSHANFDEIGFFMETHPNWPDMKKMRNRAEISMRDSAVADADIIRFFEFSPPVTGVGKWTYVEALKRQKLKPELYSKLIKEAWRDADLSEQNENILLEEFGDLLTVDDHIARIDRLLWDAKTAAAERLIPKVPLAYQTMFAARVALIKEEKRGVYLVSQVTGKLAKDPGLLYERMKFRAKKNDDAGVREILLMMPMTVPYPERWWKIREAQIREAIDDGNYKMAMKLLANHGQSDVSNRATALWLSGWIRTEFLGAAKAGYQDFYKMYDEVKYPVSKARAAYWAARAARKSSDADAAKEWFSTAASYTTTFYGQLAYHELNPDNALPLPAEPALAHGGIAEDLREAIKICVKAGADSLANRLIKHVIDTADNENTILSVAQLGHDLHAPRISVKAAKRAQQQGVVLKDVGYPRPQTAAELPLERALTLAIIRQESEFDPNAQSPSGALGMMQLLKGTAKETAKKIDVAWEPGKISDPEYNIMLGSNYLARMINAFDGSYMLGVASYNGGPGNVKKWVAKFGNPPKDTEGAIDWMEKIPFEETRNYVQRVMENMQVYRALEDSEMKLGIEDDLVR